MGKNDLKINDWLFWLFYHWLKHDDLSQNLFLEVKKPEIKETKGTFIIQKLKSSYWGSFSGLKTQDLIKTSRIFTGVIFCPRSFCSWTKKMVNFFLLPAVKKTPFSVQLEKFSVLPILKRFTNLNLDCEDATDELDCDFIKVQMKGQKFYIPRKSNKMLE